MGILECKISQVRRDPQGSLSQKKYFVSTFFKCILKKKKEGGLRGGKWMNITEMITLRIELIFHQWMQWNMTHHTQDQTAQIYLQMPKYL